jgi:hypothetical protein
MNESKKSLVYLTMISELHKQLKCGVSTAYGIYATGTMETEGFFK